MLEAHRLRQFILWTYIFTVCIQWNGIDALPGTTTIPHITHIVSYVHQGTVKSKNADIKEFDFEKIQDSGSGRTAAIHATAPPSGITQLHGVFVEQLDMSLNNTNFLNHNTKTAVATSSPKFSNITDDLLMAHQNTLEGIDEVFGHNEQHESSTTVKNDSTHPMWNRMKQSIPVLEPVRHLLNTVRDQHNQTLHAAKQFHHVLANMAGGLEGDHGPSNESSAIETEEDRETANDSTEFKLLDLVGSIVSMLWGFVGNLQRVFAASSGGVLSSSSASSSGSQ
ncbi:uncharacterized protein [Eurosta solidaginis]|uniref:uncharacterized protein n=1 Tax=Eurosta solidaginis TaxID=178769 RepID=UPI003530FAB3